MNKYNIISIVEGDGEEEAVPILIAKWLKMRNYFAFRTPERAINVKGNGRLLADYDHDYQRGIEYWVSMAQINKPHAILVVVDGEKECARRERMQAEKLGPELLRRATAAVPHIPVGAVVAHHMYEAWFLAGLPQLKNAGIIARDKKLPNGIRPEDKGGCKGFLQDLLGRPYSETTDQAEFSKYLVFTSAMKRRSPSFGKFLRELEKLTKEVRKKRPRKKRAELRTP